MLNFLGDVGALSDVLTSFAAIVLIEVLRLDLTLDNDYLSSVFR